MWELKGCLCKSRRPNKAKITESLARRPFSPELYKTSQFAHMMSGAVSSTIVGAHQEPRRHWSKHQRSHFAQGAKMVVRASSHQSAAKLAGLLLWLRLLVFGAAQTLGLVGLRSKPAMPHWPRGNVPAQVQFDWAPRPSISRLELADSLDYAGWRAENVFLALRETDGTGMCCLMLVPRALSLANQYAHGMVLRINPPLSFRASPRPLMMCVPVGFWQREREKELGAATLDSCRADFTPPPCSPGLCSE